MPDLKCPNCGCPSAPGADGKCICAQCGGSFTFNGGEAKLAGIGEIDRMKEKLDRHDADLAELKKALPASRPGQQPPEDPSGNPDPPVDDDEDEEDL